MGFPSLIKPSMWALSPGLVAPEWRWFWQGNKSALLFNDNITLDNLNFYDYAARKIRTAIVPVDTGSSDVVSTEFGLGWKTNNGTTTHNRGIPLDVDTLFGVTSFTILAYLKMHSENRDDTNEHNIYDEFESGKQNGLFRYDPAANALEGFAYDSAQRGGTFSTGTDIDDGDYHTVVLRYNGTLLEAFKDGQKDTTNFALSGTIGQSAGVLPVWSAQNAASNDGGQFIWQANGIFRNVALTDAQILQWSLDPFGPFRMADEVVVVFGLPAAVVAASINLVMAPYTPT